jgi:outer membrane receptor protein involved in Fe transport
MTSSKLKLQCARFGLLLALFHLAIVDATAQAVTGRIVGTVTDVSEAVLPGASITITNEGTGYKWTYKTDAAGQYVAPSLPPGSYRIQIEAGGFRSAVSTNNIVDVAVTTRADFTLQVGTVSEVVDVKATAPLVRSTTSELGETIGAKQIRTLPLNGRIFSQLVTLTPGAIAFGSSDQPENPAAAGARSAISASVNGLPWSGTSYTIDGVTNVEPQNAFISMAPPLEAIEEFKVQTNNPSAEFGTFGGAAVALNMRSGSNELHGSLFEFLRNDALNARSFFAATKAPFKTNQFGGTIGGPIIRNKAFFFADYQGLQLRLGRTFVLNVPSTNMRNGIFTAAEGFGTIYDPDNNFQPFNNNQVPLTRFDAVADKARNIWPTPNVTAARPVGNYVENNSQSQTAHQVDIKGDYQLGEKVRLFVRESYAKRDELSPSPGNRFIGGQENANSWNHNAAFGYTHTFSASLLSELRLGFNRFNTFHYGNDFGVNENNILGIKNGNLPLFPESSGIANFNISGLQATGAPLSSNGLRLGNTYQINEGVVWIRSSHTFRFGVDLRRTDSVVTNPEGNPRGEFQFDTSLTSNQGSGGAAFASFLLGYPSTINRGVVSTKGAVRVYNNGLYVQDDWRVRRTLTLNLGLRWDVATHPVERHNRQTNFSPQDGLMHVATGDNRGPNVDTFKGGFAPRVGIAYSPDNGKTAIRTAFGISYFADNFGANGGTLERNFPLFQTFSFTKQSTFVPFAKLSVDGLPNAVPIALTPTIVPLKGAIPILVAKDFRPDTAYMWNFGIQRQITGSSVLETTYVGTHGSHLFRDRSNIDVALPGSGAIDPRRPYFAVAPQIQQVRLRATDGDSSYNALQVKYTKRYSHGLDALVSYTYSKSIDDQNVFWPYNDRLNRGVSNSKALDLRHNLTVGYGYELPFGRGRHWLSSAPRALDLIASGWSVNGITQMRPGDPLVITEATSLLNNGLATNRANITCTGVPLTKTVAQWFDTSCFASPAQFVFGNAGKGQVHGPGIINFDFSAFKRFNFDEKRALEFRSEFFNIFNNAHFANPATAHGNSNFGQIQNTVLTPREVQLGLKLTF